MAILMLLLTSVLLLIAATHALWGCGVWFPIRDEKLLARTVVGARGVDRMPGSIPCFLVVVAIGVLVAAIWLPMGVFRSGVLWIGAVALIGRGGLAYSKIWRRMTPEEPFATYDRTRYGPLCLMLGAGVTVLALGGGG